MKSTASKPAAYSVNSFCEAHGISRAFFYELRRKGLGPNVVKLGSRTLITQEAASHWRASLDSQSQRELGGER